jgi:hypothetical protein
MTTKYLFKLHCAETIVDCYCDICEKNVPTTQTIEIQYTPKVLIFCTLNGRFEQYRKQDGSIAFRRVKGVVISPELILPIKEKKYKLSTVIYHSGESPSSGHYVAAVNYNNQWYILDDYDISYGERNILLDEYEQMGNEESPQIEYTRPSKDSRPIPSSEWAAGIPILDGGKISSTASNKFYVYLLGYTLLEADSEVEENLINEYHHRRQQQQQESNNNNKGGEENNEHRHHPHHPHDHTTTSTTSTTIIKKKKKNKN